MFTSFKKAALICVGFISVFLAILGVFLPLLPTTPFLLLAAACFAKSSKKFHQRLLNDKYFGHIIRDWQQHRCIDKKVKVRAYVFIVLSFSFSIYWVGLVYLKVMLLLMMCGLLYFLYNAAEEPN
jgi:uncharacterized membrane protein YbaN (DUF454 family)